MIEIERAMYHTGMTFLMKEKLKGKKHQKNILIKHTRFNILQVQKAPERK